MIINSNNVVLRKWLITDIEDLVRIGNDPDIAYNMNDGFPDPFTKEKAKIFIMNAIESTNLLFAITSNGKILGSIGAFFDDDNIANAVIAYYIGREFWNKGFASSAIKVLINYLSSVTKITTIVAEPFERNKGSRRVLEKNGFELININKNGGMKDGNQINTCKYELKIRS